MSEFQRFQRFIPFVKVDEAKREVYGIVTAEVEDKSGETCHYDSTKAHYKDWSAEFVKATDGKSCGNLRYMHTLRAVGKGITLEFDDAGKEILMGFKVTDDDAWSDVQEGVLTGFSQGGDYVKKWKDGKTRYYTAKPAEVSLVDNPCLGVAHFAYVKGDGSVELRKLRRSDDAASGNYVPAPGATLPNNISGLVTRDEVAGLVKSAVEEALRKEAKTKRVAGEDLPASAFAFVGDKEDTSTWKLPIKFSTEEKTKSHIRNALARFNQTQGIPEGEKSKVLARIKRAAREHGIDSDTAEKAAAARPLVNGVIREVRKGMGEVSMFANLLASLAWLYQNTRWETDREADDSPVPADLLDRIKDLCAVFLDMAQEEVAELTEPGEGQDLFAFATFAELKKASAVFARAAQQLKSQAGSPANKGVTAMPDLIKKTGLREHIKKAKEMAADHHEKLQDHLDKCVESMGKAATAPDLLKRDGVLDHLRKAKEMASDHHEKLQDHLDKMDKAVDAYEEDKKDGKDGKEEKEAGKAAKAAADLLTNAETQFAGVMKGMQDQFEAFMAQLAKAGEQLVPPRASVAATNVRSISKTEDNGGKQPPQTAEAVVFKARGPQGAEVSEEFKSAMRNVYRTGGVPLAVNE